MGPFRLAPKAYEALQRIVHRDHAQTFEVLRELLRLEPGERVIEVGCGTGLLAQHFVRNGYDYWGLDRDERRCEKARVHVGGGRFLVGDATALASLGLPPARRFFLHGVLHHLDDGQCRSILEQVLGASPETVLVVIEPFAADRPWRHPLWSFAAAADEGRFVRTLGEWRSLLGSAVDELRIRRLPRWPVPFLDCRLTAPSLD